MASINKYPSRVVPDRFKRRRSFVKTEERPKTMQGVCLPDELWLSVVALLCVSYAYHAHVEDRLLFLLPDLARFDEALAKDYKDAVKHHNILR